jgi:hypothetical protein
MHLLIVVIAVGSALMAFASCIAANLCVYMMVENVNKLLPGDKQYSQMWWYPGKLFRVCGDYKRLYPHGRLSGYMGPMSVVMGVALITVFAALVAMSSNTTAR